MIVFLNGMVRAKQDQTCWVDVQGVGYEVTLPVSDWERLPGVGESVMLYTWYLGREDGVQLFGFISTESRNLFKILLGVNGVGPKAALAVLSGLSKAALEMAVVQQDVAAFSRLPGIGKKTAERLLLELKDKLKPPALACMPSGGSEHQEVLSQAFEGLLALGYSALQARTVLQKVHAEARATLPENDQVAQLIRLALKQL